MNDYTRTSDLIRVLEKSMKDNNHLTIEGSRLHAQEHRHIIHLVEKQPTISETDIIRKVFERVIERLREKVTWKSSIVNDMIYSPMKKITVEEAIKIIKEECGISE